MFNKIKKLILSSFDEKDIVNEYIKRFQDDKYVESLNKKEIKRVKEELTIVDGFKDYLLDLLKNDRITYFNSVDKDKDMIKGAFLRTKFFYDIVTKTKNRDIKDDDQKDKINKGPIRYNNPRQA